MADKKQYTPVRFSHLTRHSAPGSVVREQSDWLVFIKDTTAWPSSKMDELQAVVRVKQHLGIHQRLLMPPADEYDDETRKTVRDAALPTVRFPSWATCSNCGLLVRKPWINNEHRASDKLVCSCRHGVLEQLTWCAVSSYGDLIDVPWHHICHRRSKERCAPDRNESYLKIIDRNSGTPKVACTKCKASDSFYFSDFELPDHYQLRDKFQRSEEGKIKYTIVEVNDSGVFMAVNAQALVIPPESNVDRNSLKYKLSINSQIIAQIKASVRPLERKKLIRRAAKQLGCEISELDHAIEQKPDHNEPLEIISGDMSSDEYEALTTQAEFPSGADFVTRHLSQEWKELVGSFNDQTLESIVSIVSRLVAVDRLRVIEVYRGFNRAASDYNDFNPKPQPVKPDFGKGEDWLPAIELFGEGVFFTLDVEMFSVWEENPELRRRASEIEHRFSSSEYSLSIGDEASASPRFIMLHTLAHILIREFEASAGYPASSLQERIYCDDCIGMAGILIYTAVPDVAGSLGGIVELAKPEKFIRLLSAAFNQAEWCSLDPVCSEIDGQGPAWLNKAACHGCALIPDTSCRYHNVLLDRVFIKGSSEIGIPSLLDCVGGTDGAQSI